MELMDNLDKGVWRKENNPGLYDFKHYTLGHRAMMVSQGTFQFTANCQDPDTEEDEHLALLTLSGARGKVNPLKDIINCELVVSEGQIVGINVDDDCVIRVGIQNGN